jgi:hypothetical protein
MRKIQYILRRYFNDTKLLQKRGYALPKILVNSNVEHVKPVGVFVIQMSLLKANNVPKLSNMLLWQITFFEVNISF